MVIIFGGRAVTTSAVIVTNIEMRLTGYGSAIGEAVQYRYQTHYKENCEVIAAFYVIAHFMYTVYWETQCFKGPLKVLVFDLLASVAIPYLINYNLCKYIANSMYSYEWIPVTIRRWIPISAGFLTIPLFLWVVDPFLEPLIILEPEKVKKAMEIFISKSFK